MLYFLCLIPLLALVTKDAVVKEVLVFEFPDGINIRIKDIIFFKHISAPDEVENNNLSSGLKKERFKSFTVHARCTEINVLL